MFTSRSISSVSCALNVLFNNKTSGGDSGNGVNTAAALDGVLAASSLAGGVRFSKPASAGTPKEPAVGGPIAPGWKFRLIANFCNMSFISPPCERDCKLSFRAFAASGGMLKGRLPCGGESDVNGALAVLAV